MIGLRFGRFMENEREREMYTNNVLGFHLRAAYTNIIIWICVFFFLLFLLFEVDQMISGAVHGTVQPLFINFQV